MGISKAPKYSIEIIENTQKNTDPTETRSIYRRPEEQILHINNTVTGNIQDSKNLV